MLVEQGSGLQEPFFEIRAQFASLVSGLARAAERRNLPSPGPLCLEGRPPFRRRGVERLRRGRFFLGREPDAPLARQQRVTVRPPVSTAAVTAKGLAPTGQARLRVGGWTEVFARSGDMELVGLPAAD